MIEETHMAEERTALYRLYDVGDQLLYIGIAVNPQERWATHASNKRWWPQVARKSVEWFNTRPLAEAAEVVGIRAEGPRYNVRHSKTLKHGDGKQEHTGNATPLRMARLPDDEWEALGQAVGNRERTRLIREYIRWHLRWPGNTQPARAKEQVGGPGVSSKSSDEQRDGGL